MTTGQGSSSNVRSLPAGTFEQNALSPLFPCITRVKKHKTKSFGLNISSPFSFVVRQEADEDVAGSGS